LCALGGGPSAGDITFLNKFIEVRMRAKRSPKSILHDYRAAASSDSKRKSSSKEVRNDQVALISLPGSLEDHQ